MHDIHTEIEIDASPDVVWNVLTDFESYPEWNPFVRSIQGESNRGAKLEVVLDQSLGEGGGKTMTMRPRVVRHEPRQQFGWLGRLWVPGLFDGEHVFELTELRGGRVRFVQREHFEGLLVPLLRRMLDTKTRPAFSAMNEALKQRSEQRARA